MWPPPQCLSWQSHLTFFFIIVSSMALQSSLVLTYFHCFYRNILHFKCRFLGFNQGSKKKKTQTNNSWKKTKQ